MYSYLSEDGFPNHNDLFGIHEGINYESDSTFNLVTIVNKVM